MKAHFGYFPTCLVMIGLTVQAATSSVNMKRVNDANIHIVPLGVSVHSVSRLACAAACRMNGSYCNSFYFNTRNNDCTLGSGIVRANSTRPTDLNLYFRGSFCNDDQNFTLSTEGDFSTSLFISNISLNYTDARDCCKDMKSHLYTLKVIESLNVLRKELSIQYPESTSSDVWAWVGMNQLETKGVYRWEGDGSVFNMSSPYKAQIFHSGQPNDYKGEQDCIAFSSTAYYPLHDTTCSQEIKFICEKKPISHPLKGKPARVV